MPRSKRVPTPAPPRHFFSEWEKWGTMYRVTRETGPQPTTKRGGRETLADPFAGQRTRDEFIELARERIERLEEENRKLKRRVGPKAAPIPRAWISMVASAKARVESLLGHEGVSPADVPEILREDPSALCYPPFAAQFAACLENGDRALWKVLRSFFEGRGASLRPYSFTARVPVSHGDPALGTTVRTIQTMAPARFIRQTQALRVRLATLEGKSIAEIAGVEKLSRGMVLKRLTEARKILGERFRHRAKKKISSR